MGDCDLPTDRLTQNLIGEDVTGGSTGVSGGRSPDTLGSNERLTVNGKTVGGQMASTLPVFGTTGWAHPVDSGAKPDSDIGGNSEDNSRDQVSHVTDDCGIDPGCLKWFGMAVIPTVSE